MRKLPYGRTASSGLILFRDLVDKAESARDRFLSFCSTVCTSRVSIDGDMIAAWLTCVSLSKGDDVYINSRVI